MNLACSTSDTYPPPPAGVYFTFVREPYAGFLSAYREITFRWAMSRWLPDLHLSPNTTSGPRASETGRIGCRTAAQSARRLAAFVRDLEGFKDLGSQVYHAWPQMIKTLVRTPLGRSTPPLDFVGRVEHFVDDMLELLASVGVTNVTREVMEEFRRNSKEVHRGRCVQKDLEATLHVPAPTRAAIESYLHADRVCLAPVGPYPRPPA